METILILVLIVQILVEDLTTKMVDLIWAILGIVVVAIAVAVLLLEKKKD